MSDFITLKGFSQYEISREGVIRMTVTSHIVKMRIHAKYGYKMCTLFDDDLIERTVYPHKEVAKTFIPISKSGKLYVIHLNGNPADNHVDNLKWVTPAEAQIHQLKIGQRKQIGNPELYKYSKTWIAKYNNINNGSNKSKRKRIKITKVFSSLTPQTVRKTKKVEIPKKKKLFND